MRTFNGRLLAMLLAGAVVFGICVYFVHAVQVQRNAHVFWQAAQRARERADAAKKEGDSRREQKEFIEALKNYSWYLTLRPKDVDALEEYGLYLVDHKQYARAFGTLEKLLRLAPDRTQVRRKLVDFAMESGQASQYLPDAKERAKGSTFWFTTARDHLQDFLLPASPDDAQLLQLLGRCQAFFDDAPKAAASFRRAIKQAPDLLDAYPRLADLLRNRLKRPAEADECIQELVQANPDSAKAHLLAGTYWKDIHSPQEAMREALRALELNADDREALLLAAQITVEMGVRLDEQQRSEAAQDYYFSARDYSQRAMKLYPDYPLVYTTRANIQVQSGDSDAAIEALRTGLKETDNDSQLLWNNVNLLIDEDKIQEAQEGLEQLRKAKYVPALIGYLQGRVEYVQGHWRATIDELERIRGGLEPWPQLLKQVDLALGKSCGKLGNPEREQAVLRRALSLDPSFTPARTALIESLLSVGKLEEALDLYRQVMKAGQPAGNLLQLIRLLILKNERIIPNQRDWQQVQAMLDAALQASPTSPDVIMLQVQVFFDQDRLKDAERLLLDARNKSPENPTYWTALVTLAQQQGEWDRTEKLLEEAQQKLGDRVELRLARATYLAVRKADDAKAKLREQAEKTESFSDAERQELWNGLLNIALLTSDFEEIERLSRWITEKDPKNLQARFLLFEVAVRAQDPAALEEPIAEIYKIEGDGPIWHYCQAVRLALRGKAGDPKLLDQALQHLKQTRDARANWSRVPLLEAGIYDHQGKLELAIDSYRKAIDMGERGTGAIRRLVQLYIIRNRNVEAEDTLRLLGAPQVPLSNDLSRLRTYINMEKGELDAALDDARKTAANSQEFRDHVWLGQILEARARRTTDGSKSPEAAPLLDEAEKALRHAVELSDKTSATWVALVKFLGATQQKEKADQVLNEVRKRVVPEQYIPMVLAQSYEALGQMEQAEEKHQEALEIAPNDPMIVRTAADYYWRAGKPQQAETLLRKILESKMPVQEGDRLWARRVLAIIWATRGTYPDLQKAEQLVQQNLDGNPSSLVDQQMMTRLKASQPTTASQNDAIAMLEKLAQSATPEDKLTLAELYRTKGLWNKFTAQMANLLTTSGNNPQYIAFYVNALLEHGEVQTAEEYLGQLQRIAPNDFATSRLRAEVLFRHGKYQAALELLKDYVDKPGAQPTDRSTRLRLAADALEQFSRRLTDATQQVFSPSYRREAELMLRDCIGQRGGGDTLLVAFLTRQGRISEALDVLESVWATNHPTAVARVCIDLLRSDQAGPEELRRGESIVRAALKRLDRPVSLLKVMAVFCTYQQRYPEAEDYYREVTQKSPNDTVAMNNLAVLLALENKNLDEALQLANKAIELAGPLGAMLDSRASVYMALREPDKALADLKQAITDAPEPIRFFHQAQAYNMLGRKEAAGKAMQEAEKRGLKLTELQPLERPSYQQLRKLIK